MTLTPNKIYNDLVSNKIEKFTAFELLISILENEENDKIRLDSLIYLEKIELINNTLFKILENLLISDYNSEIRNFAAYFIRKKFLSRAITPFKWAMNHETDFNCLITVIKSLEKIDSDESKTILFQKVKKIIKMKYLNKAKKIENKKHTKVLKSLIKEKKYIDFTHLELADILINFYIIYSLINKFPNVYYRLNSHNGLIEELDLSDIMEYEVRGTPWGWKNNIKTLSQIAGLNYLTNLKKLDLSNNQIENLEGLNTLLNLTQLIISNNKISNIKNINHLKKLPNLEYLDLRGNKIVQNITKNNFSSKMTVLLSDSYIKIK